MSFSSRIIAWQKVYGRHGLPWQCNDPYRVWLSEIMLQQTQVSTVIPYYQKFLAQFPNAAALAAADEDAVLAAWAGLGYYARARNLHTAAKQVVEDFGGQFPDSRSGLEKLKGVGRSTAAAVAVFAFGRREAILDGNVKRILARHQALPLPVDSTAGIAALWQTAEALLPEADIGAYTQGLMDLGSLVCTRGRPQCRQCPVRTDCAALAQQAVDAYPVKAAKKVRPVKQGYFLLAADASGAVLLRKRPPRGIWGGLWCLPEFASAAALAAAHPQADAPVLAHVHQFTHYTLQMFVCRMAADAGASGLFDAEACAKLGMPAPIALLLADA